LKTVDGSEITMIQNKKIRPRKRQDSKILSHAL